MTPRASVLLVQSVLILLVSGAASADAATVTFGWTGGEQVFTVPGGVTSIHVVATGGHGGSSFTGLGGPGAVAISDLPVIPGQSLYVEVGGNGVDHGPDGGYNGGGAAGPYPASSGGGGSDVRTAPALDPDSLATRLIVAGGGGGGTLFVAGGAAGSSGSLPGGTGGNPGTDTGGGLGGNGSAANAGSLGQGGHGAGAAGQGGGGGGGGLYGGGGGAGGTQICSSVNSCAWTNGGGGGGGSSGFAPLATNTSWALDTTGVPTVVIAYADPPPPGQLTLSKVVAGAHGALKVPATVSSAGRVNGVAVAHATGSKTGRTLIYGRAEIAATQGGLVALRITPGKTAWRLLKRRGKLRVTVTVTFTPTDGGASNVQTTQARVHVRRQR